MVALRVFGCFVLFLACMFLKLLLLDLPGLFIAPFNIWFKSPKLLWLWQNDEDGPDPQWYKDLNPTWSEFRRQYAWLAIRNRTDNLQFTWFCAPPIPGLVRVEYFKNGGFICWQGWRAYVWTPLPTWVPKFEAASFGWNHYPADNTQVMPPIRTKGCGYGGKLTVRQG